MPICILSIHLSIHLPGLKKLSGTKTNPDGGVNVYSFWGCLVYIFLLLKCSWKPFLHNCFIVPRMQFVLHCCTQSTHSFPQGSEFLLGVYYIIENLFFSTKNEACHTVVLLLFCVSPQILGRSQVCWHCISHIPKRLLTVPPSYKSFKRCLPSKTQRNRYVLLHLNLHQLSTSTFPKTLTELRLTFTRVSQHNWIFIMQWPFWEME